MPDNPTDKGYVVKEQIAVKDLATWQPYADDKVAYGPALKEPRELKK